MRLKAQTPENRIFTGLKCGPAAAQDEMTFTYYHKCGDSLP